MSKIYTVEELRSFCSFGAEKNVISFLTWLKEIETDPESEWNFWDLGTGDFVLKSAICKEEKEVGTLVWNFKGTWEQAEIKRKNWIRDKFLLSTLEFEEEDGNFFLKDKFFRKYLRIYISSPFSDNPYMYFVHADDSPVLVAPSIDQAIKLAREHYQYKVISLTQNLLRYL